MQYDFSVNANSGMDINALGHYVKYKSGLGAIRVRASAGGYIDLTPGQSIRMDKEFMSINVADKSGNFNQGVLIIGDVEFQDDSIIGVVSTVDGARNSTLSKACFMGSVASGATAGVFNYSTIINPAASQKNVFLVGVYYTGSTGNLKLGGLGLVPAGVRHAVNKSLAISGGVLSVAFLESATNVTDLLDNSNTLINHPVQANVSQYIKFAEPILVPPGMGLILTTGTVATGHTVTFEFREDPL
jgi:hypothetical protein